VLADHHESQEDLPEALRCRALVLEIWCRLLPETDWRVVDARLALEHCRRLKALSSDERKKILRARSLNREMLELYQRGKLDDALKLGREALALRKSVLGERHRDCAESLHNFALPLQAQGQMAQAQQLMEEALTIRQALLGSAHPATITSLNNLGAICLNRGDHPKARTFLERATAGIADLNGKRSSEYAIALNNLSTLHRKLGNNDLALRLIQQAVVIEREAAAEEVASLDLRCVDLAVLSACETGLGTIRAVEGVMGLQRAFHQAGARTLVTSLWNVSDPATSVLMEEMYRRHWSEKKTTRLEALRQAQLYVLHNPDKVVACATQLQAQMPGIALRSVGKKALPLPEGGKVATRRSPPAWWAAFVLSGDPGR
jgi:tetratricopeptide (TPR) repeat protein